MGMIEKLEKIQKMVEDNNKSLNVAAKALGKATWLLEEINKFHPLIVERAIESYERRKK